MKKLLYLYFLFIGYSAFAQTPTDYFVECANLYVDSKITEAKRQIDIAVNQFPEDKKLQALKEKIEEEQEKQQQQQQQQQQNQDQQQEQQQNEQQQNEQQEQQEQQQQEQEQEQDQNQQQQPQPQKAEISEEDARRLLEALENEEKKLQQKLMEQKARSKKVKTEKNW